MKKKIIILITVFSLIKVIAAPLHSIHISYGEAKLTSREFSGKITFYKNDFMTALKNFNNGSLEKLSGEEFTKLKNRYLEARLKVFVNGSAAAGITISGNSEDDNSIWFEFKFVFDTPVQNIKIHNSILFKEFGDQMNLLNIKTPGGEEGRIFKSSEPEITVKM